MTLDSADTATCIVGKQRLLACLLTTNRRNTQRFTVNDIKSVYNKKIYTYRSNEEKANVVSETSKFVPGYATNLPRVFASNRPPTVCTRQCAYPVSSTQHSLTPQTHIRAATGPISSPNRLIHCPLTAEARVPSQDTRGFR